MMKEDEFSQNCCEKLSKEKTRLLESSLRSTFGDEKMVSSCDSKANEQSYKLIEEKMMMIK